MDEELIINVDEDNEMTIEATETIGVIRNYNDLNDKPQINQIELEGNKSLDDLGVQKKGDYANSRITNIEIDNLFE